MLNTPRAIEQTQNRFCVLLLAVLLYACGGGGGGGSGSETIAVATPSITIAPPLPTVPLTPVAHIQFADVTQSAGLAFTHGYMQQTMGSLVSAGVAVGDVDNDGWLDVYLTQSDAGKSKLFKNVSQGGSYSFVDATTDAGVSGDTSDKASGPAFVDYDGDGDLDLFVGGVDYTPVRVFQNLGNGRFNDVSSSTGFADISRENNIGMAFGDVNNDAHLDLFISHWTFTENELPSGSTQHLWKNNGDGTFSDISNESMLTLGVIEEDADYTFSPTFADIDNDGDADLLVVADNTTSQVLINNTALGGGAQTFSNATDRALISDDAGMGSSVADFDNDGDLDWFVTSISLGDSLNNRPTEQDNAGFNLTGNRYYRNEGNGIFSDQTDVAGVRKGYWGWGSCAADFNNDGHVDIFHVNGMDEPITNAYLQDPSRLFINNANGSFTEYAEPMGLIDTRSGRGVTCFDGDQDGDIDILIANNRNHARLFRNDGGNQLNYLNIGLRNKAPNTRAIGARIFVTHNGLAQLREVIHGSNYMSHNPTEQHFGLGDTQHVNQVVVRWPDGSESTRANVEANQRITVNYPDNWSFD